ncbi:hypothetical protein KY284_001173 [Solanum tuberosum]|nr:hypothetical protein KY284_001173 [Solanum tuberosum]
MDVTLVEMLVSRYQATKDVLAMVNQAVVPAPPRGVNSSLRRLCASLAAKDEEITALRVSHLALINQLHSSYYLEHSGLEEDNAHLKADLALDQEALLAEKSTNSVNLKDLYDLLKKDLPLPLIPHTLLPILTMPCVPSGDGATYDYFLVF